MQLLFRHTCLVWIRKLPSLLVVSGLLLAPLQAQAQSLIRDTEIEHTLRVYSDPVFEKAGLVPSSIHMYIVNDEAINAFVMGGSNVFVNTGLITQTATPDMLIGVIAHETGHIAGGHLVRGAQAAEKAQLQALLGYLLGAAAMAGGAGNVGAAVMSANENIAMRGLYSHTRANEQAADQAALTILDKLGITANGMLQMLEILRKQENRKLGPNADPYLRTHPLNKERIMHIRNHVAESSLGEHAVPNQFNALHARMLGKLEGFLDDPKRVLERYPLSNTSVKARYARAVAYHRQVDNAKAIAEMDALLADAPEDPYFHELKGQLLFESGKIEAAHVSYEKAVSLLPDAPLIRTELGRVLLARESDNTNLPEATKQLEYATSQERNNPQAWRLLATAYGRSGRMGESHLALAEEALALNEPETAIQQLDVADPQIAVGSPAQLRAQDLRQEALERKKNNKDKK